MNIRRTVFRAKSATVRRSAGALYSELLEHDNWSADRLEDLATRRRVAIARFAFDHSPFYAALYRSSGFSSTDDIDAVTFDQLPTVDRTSLKESGDHVWTDEAAPSNTRDALTGGSTGQPLRTGQDSRIPASALSWRMYHWWGVEPEDNIGRVGRWGVSRKDRLKNGVQWWPTRHAFLDTGSLTETSMTAFLLQVDTIRPRLIEGYVGGLLELARFVSSSEWSTRLPGLVIGTTSGPLRTETRNEISKGFMAPVYDQYRSSEVQWIAGECERQSGLHIFSDMRRVEVLDEFGATAHDGVVGNVVVTDYANRVYPMIRYRLGDRAATRAGACGCGRPYPLIEPIQGRTVDVLRLPGGEIIASGVAAMFSEAVDAVREFQVYQRDDYSIALRVIASEHPDARLRIDEAAEQLRSRLGWQVPVVIEYVTTIAHARGKLQYVISDAPGPPQA